MPDPAPNWLDDLITSVTAGSGMEEARQRTIQRLEDAVDPQALALGVGQGATFNFLDEVVGALSAAGRAAQGNVPTFGLDESAQQLTPDETYQATRDLTRRATHEAEERSPVQTGIGELGGMVLTAPLLGPAEAAGATRTASTGARIGRAAREGAVLGGLSAAGANEDPASLPWDILTGVVGGGLTGGTLGTLGAGARRLIPTSPREVDRLMVEAALPGVSVPATQQAAQAAGVRELGVLGAFRSPRAIRDRAQREADRIAGEVLGPILNGPTGRQELSQMAERASTAAEHSGEPVRVPEPDSLEAAVEEIEAPMDLSIPDEARAIADVLSDGDAEAQAELLRVIAEEFGGPARVPSESVAAALEEVAAPLSERATTLPQADQIRSLIENFRRVYGDAIPAAHLQSEIEAMTGPQREALQNVLNEHLGGDYARAQAQAELARQIAGAQDRVLSRQPTLQDRLTRGIGGIGLGGLGGFAAGHGSPFGAVGGALGGVALSELAARLSSRVPATRAAAAALAQRLGITGDTVGPIATRVASEGAGTLLQRLRAAAGLDAVRRESDPQPDDEDLERVRLESDPQPDESDEQIRLESDPQPEE